MDTFQITIQRASEEGWPVVVEWSASKTSLPVRNGGLLQLDLVALNSQVTSRDYGTVLGQALFRDDVRDAFIQARSGSEDHLSVLLFVEDGHLRTLRWERLCAPLDHDWDFLSLHQRTPFSLYLPSATGHRFRPFGRRDLRALIVVASPEGLERFHLAPFAVEAAVRSVQTALGDIPYDVLAPVKDAVGPPTLDAICEHLTTTSYTLLHLVCHGRYQADSRETVLFLAGANQQVDPISATHLVERLQRLGGAHSLPHFAFLATCESASPQAEGTLGGLAQRLVRELGMPAVLAMTEHVSVSTAQALAQRFYQQLRKHGQVDLAVVEAYAGLAERSDITVPALYSRLGARPLFTDALDRELTPHDLRLGLSRLKDLFLERAPILWEPLQSLLKTVQQSVGTTAALSEVERGERKRALEEINLYCLETLSLSFHALALGEEPQPYDSRCPFLGLSSFGPEQQEFFFGREVLIKHLQQRLRHYPFLAIVGPSGCGKSSLVLAGLVPSLQRDEPELQLIALTPGSEPEEQLQGSLAHVDESRPCVLVFDQFEELFTLCSSEKKRQAFLKALLTLVPKHRVIITMRADFLADFAPYQPLKALLQEHLELMAPMSPAELRRAMELQVATVGLRFDADLSGRILDEVEREPAAMPLLQHALLELWQRRHGYWLRVEEYRAIGGIKQAIARTADAVYEGLEPAEQKRTREIFMRLTKPDVEALPGEEKRDTRQRVGLEELVPIGTLLEVTKGLVKRLADVRLIVTSVNSVTGREEVEVAHEALIRNWPRLRHWLDEERDSLRLRERLRDAIREWERRGRSSDRLYRGDQLKEAKTWAEHNTPSAGEVEFIQASEAESQRQATERQKHQERELTLTRQTVNRLRLLVITVTVLLVVSIVFTCVAQVLEQQATAQARNASSRALAADANLASSQDKSDLALLLSVKAYQTSPTLEARNSLLNALMQNPQMVTMLHSGSQIPIKMIVFTSDGLKVISSDGYSVYIGGVQTRQESLLPLRSQQFVDGLALSPDDRTLATASAAGVWLWDIQKGKQLGQLDTTTNLAEGTQAALAFSSNGQVLTSARCSQYSTDNTVCVETKISMWDVHSQRPIGSPYHIPVNADTVTFSSGGKMLASSSGTSIQIWDAATGKHSGSPLVTLTSPVTSLAFSSNGTTLASASGIGNSPSIQLWNVATRVSVGIPLIGHAGWVTDLAFSSDGLTLASSSRDGTIRVWDMGHKKPTLMLKGDAGEKWSVVFSPDRVTPILASGSIGGTTILWNIDAENTISQRLAKTGILWSPIFTPDGTRVLTGGRDEIILWNAKTGFPVDPLKTNSYPLLEPKDQVTDDLRYIESLTLSKDGETLASGRLDGTVLLWNMKTRTAFAPFRYPTLLYKVILSANAQILVAVGSGNTIMLWDTSKKTMLPSIPYIGGSEYRQPPVALSPDGKLLAIGGCGMITNDNCEKWQVQLWDVATGTMSGQPLLGYQSQVSAVAFSPDGHTLASSSQDGILLWNITTRQTDHQLLIIPDTDNDYYHSLVFSPNGGMLASSTPLGTPFSFVLWNVAPGESHEAFTNPIQESGFGQGMLAFSSDERHLVSVSLGAGFGSLTLWNITPESWQGRACFIANRDLNEREWQQFVKEEGQSKVCQ